MPDFDPIKAETEVLQGMLDVHKAIRSACQGAEKRASEADNELQALLKVDGYVAQVVLQQQLKLKALREAAAKPPPPPSQEQTPPQ